MEIDRDKAIKLIIIVIATIAALAATNVLVQLISTILPFVIVGAGAYVGYRWVLSDTRAPTADEMEEQARGLFSRFRKTKEAVETTVKVGSALNNLTNRGNNNNGEETTTAQDNVVQGQATAVKPAPAKPAPQPKSAPEPDIEDTVEEQDDEDDRDAQVEEMKKSLESNPKGKIKFKDRDVVISKDDVVQPDTSRLEEKEKEVPKVTNDVLAQIEERRRRLQQGGE